MTAAVICVHGVWMPGTVMLLVKRRLENRYGYRAHLFDYPSHRATLDANARLLAEFVRGKDLEAVHLVAHSLGGVVALRMLALQPGTPVQRVVCLGAPLNGSRVASRLTQARWGNAILGKSVTTGVVGDAPGAWVEDVCASHEVGVIAGTVPIGLGRLATSFEGDNDGTVAVSETRLSGAKDHICMPVTHTGLVLSLDVVHQVAAFLARGEFLKAV